MTTAQLPCRHVMVIDDCPATRELMNVILSVEGYTITGAANGQEALRRLEAGPLPDLILLDMTMPVMTGWEFLRRRKADPRLAGIPILIFSAIGDGVEDLEALGVVGSLTKPIHEDTLIDRIIQAVRTHCPDAEAAPVREKS
jgi:CheY-like chemotaxis protein